MAWFDTLLKPELASLRAYHPTPAPPGAIRLDANESPYGLSDTARRHVADALARVDMHRYPDVRATRLRELVAEANGAHPEQVILGCGSDEVIALLVTALGAPRPGRARAAFAFPDPSFVMFRITSLVQGAEPVAVPLDETWDLDVDAFATALAAHLPNAVFLPSPNNPTGNLFSDDRIERVIGAASGHGSLVVLDEAYGRFARRTYRALRERHENVGQLQTLSKIGLAASRVGWAILPRELAVAVDKARQPYNLNALSQRVGELAFTDLRDEIDAAAERIIAERERVTLRLSGLSGCAMAPSSANFVWLDVRRDAGEIHRQLLERGIMVRSFHTNGGRLANWVRVTIGTPEENNRLVEALEALLA